MNSFMKFLFFMVVLFGLNVQGIAQKFTEPVAFNDFIVKEQLECGTRNLKYMSEEVHNPDPQKVEAKRQEVIQQLKGSIAKIKNISYKGGEFFKEESLAAFETYLGVIENDYPILSEMQQKGIATMEEMEAYLDYQNVIDYKLTQAAAQMEDAQIDFANKQEMRIVEVDKGSRLSGIMEKMNAVNIYIRKVSLLQFTLQIAMNQVIDAINQGNAAEFETQRKALIAVTDKALQALATIGSYNNDSRLFMATREFAVYFGDLGKNQLPKLTKIVGNPNITQKELDTYNQLMPTINTKVSELGENYNKVLGEFTTKNFPIFKG